MIDDDRVESSMKWGSRIKIWFEHKKYYMHNYIIHVKYEWINFESFISFKRC